MTEEPDLDVEALLARMDAPSRSASPTTTGLVDCLRETWIVVRIDRDLTDDELLRVKSLLAVLGRDSVPEVWISHPEHE